MGQLSYSQIVASISRTSFQYICICINFIEMCLHECLYTPEVHVPALVTANGNETEISLTWTANSLQGSVRLLFIISFADIQIYNEIFCSRYTKVLASYRTVYFPVDHSFALCTLRPVSGAQPNNVTQSDKIHFEHQHHTSFVQKLISVI